MSRCQFCDNGYLERGDVECVNGVLIDIDEAHEGSTDVCHPPAPCMSCQKCRGKAADGETECSACNSTGWKTGKDESLELLEEWREPYEPARSLETGGA